MEGAEAGNVQEPLTGARFVNPEAERSVLGAMLRSKTAAQAGLDGLGAGDFFDPGNREVFDAMRSVADGGQAVDLITVDQELTRRGKLEVVGGAAYLIELTQGVPSAANVGAYIGIVKGLAKRRAAIQAAEALAQGLKDPAADVDAVLGQLRDAADGLETGGKLKLVPLDEASLCMMTGASHMRLESYDRAVDCLTMCLDRDPENSFALYLRASCLLAAERYPDAIADFEAAMAAGEDEERCRYGRAVCLSQMGDSEGALKDFDWVMLNGSDEQLFAESAKLMTRLLNGEGEAAQD